VEPVDSELDGAAAEAGEEEAADESHGGSGAGESGEGAIGILGPVWGKSPGGLVV
jgi:hypothetical protein